MKKKRVVLIILDSCGIGELPDADKYNDIGSNTLGNTAKAVGGISLPHLENLGFGNITPILGVKPEEKPEANFGRMAEQSLGKDSTIGHWEIAGLIIDKPFPLYQQGFPSEIMEKFKRTVGKDILGNKPASGTEIIKELGEEHIKTGKLIVYTSADSVFQIAAHEEIVPVEKLYEFCQKAREILVDKHGVARVIARPFIGKPGNFQRTERRKDFSLPPPKDTILDILKKNNIPVIGIGKIEDLFAGKGLTKAIHTSDNQDGTRKLLQTVREEKEGLILINLVDFDMIWGHRNDVRGFAKGFKDFDEFLPQLLQILREDDILILTADHGCDPTTKSTDHSREYVPLLVYGKKLKKGINLGTRKSFSDIAQTLSDIFKVKGTGNGKSFFKEISF